MDERHQVPWAERVLVERLTCGDETALVDLYDRYAGFVYGLAAADTPRAAGRGGRHPGGVRLPVGASGAHRPGPRDPPRFSRDAHPPPSGRRRPPRRGAVDAGRRGWHAGRAT